MSVSDVVKDCVYSAALSVTEGLEQFPKLTLFISETMVVHCLCLV